eukprot:PhF_6_TR18581/c0_g1_i1/m.27145/K17888/ATG10L, ATG10; ubiquitin-like-conjugating enzyme ATG10
MNRADFNADVDVFLANPQHLQEGWVRKESTNPLTGTTEPYLQRGPFFWMKRAQREHYMILVTITFCNMYNVPVIHFFPTKCSDDDNDEENGEDASSSICSLEDVVLPFVAVNMKGRQEGDRQDSYNIVGWGVHPIHSIPWYILQPCTTHDLLLAMRTNQNTSKGIITSIDVILQTMGRWIGI